eukprot:scaffold2858_cov659-Pavlova_lutheri.AAC.116
MNDYNALSSNGFLLLEHIGFGAYETFPGVTEPVVAPKHLALLVGRIASNFRSLSMGDQFTKSTLVSKDTPFILANVNDSDSMPSSRVRRLPLL